MFRKSTISYLLNVYSAFISHTADLSFSRVRRNRQTDKLTDATENHAVRGIIKSAESEYGSEGGIITPEQVITAMAYITEFHHNSISLQWCHLSQ